MFLGGADTYNNNYIQICAGGSSSVFNNAPAGIEIHDKYESEKHSGLVTIKPGLKVSGGATISGRITGNSLTIAAGAAISGAATIGGIITGNGGAIITGSSGANLNETGGTSEGQVGLTIKGGTGGLNKQGYRHNGGTGLVVYGGGLYSGAGTGGATGKAIIAHGDVSISGDTEITGDVNISGYLNVKNGLAISTDTPNTASDCKDFQLNGSWTHSPQHQYLFIRGYGNRDDYVYLLFDKSIYPENSVVFLNGYKRNIRLVRNAKGDTQNIDNITILMLFGSTFTYNNNTYWAISSDNYYAIG